jgi:hypothetical protein
VLVTFTEAVKPEFQLFAEYATLQVPVGTVSFALVVTDRAVDAAETFPAASLALTVNEYAVEAVRPVAVKLVVVEVPTDVPLAKIS